MKQLSPTPSRGSQKPETIPTSNLRKEKYPKSVNSVIFCRAKLISKIRYNGQLNSRLYWSSCGHPPREMVLGQTKQPTAKPKRLKSTKKCSKSKQKWRRKRSGDESRRPLSEARKMLITRVTPILMTFQRSRSILTNWIYQSKGPAPTLTSTPSHNPPQKPPKPKSKTKLQESKPWSNIWAKITINSRKVSYRSWRSPKPPPKSPKNLNHHFKPNPKPLWNTPKAPAQWLSHSLWILSSRRRFIRRDRILGRSWLVRRHRWLSQQLLLRKLHLPCKPLWSKNWKTSPKKLS